MKVPSNLNVDQPLRSRAQHRAAGIDMTPMVDVTFLLLIFFMVTASFTLQRAIAMPRQVSDLASFRSVQPPTPVQTVSLSVDRFGGFYLATPLGEQELVGKQSLVTALKTVAESNSDARLEISVDDQVRLQSMIDAIDAGTIAGFTKLTVTQIDGQADSES